MVKRIFCILLAAVLLVGMTACEGEQASESSAAVSEAESTIATIRYPELITDELAASALYAQALTQPSVISINGEPATDRTVVDDFLQAVQDGTSGELYLYTFQSSAAVNEYRSCGFHHFATSGGKITIQADFQNNWDDPFAPTESAVQSVELTEYGYLVCRDGTSSEPSGYPVINDRNLFANAEERRQMYDTYLKPIYYTALGDRIWSSLAELEQWVWLYEDIYHYENNASPFDAYGSDWPVTEMAELLNRYFDGVTPEMLTAQAGSDYDPATNTIHYEGGRGGGPLPLRVTDWQQDGNILSINYEHYNYTTGIPDSSFVLTIRLMEDGSFRYLSNQAAAQDEQTAAKEIVSAALREGQKAERVFCADFPVLIHDDAQSAEQGFFAIDRNTASLSAEEAEILAELHSTEDIRQFFHTRFTDAVADTLLSEIFSDTLVMYKDVDGALYQNSRVSITACSIYHWQCEPETMTILSVSDTKIQATAQLVRGPKNEPVGTPVIEVEKDAEGNWQLNESYFFDYYNHFIDD